jgi:hypothetical protein
LCPTGAVGGDGDDGDDKEKEEEAERERQEVIKEAEDRRKEKHRKMEEEREKMRQEIRDKVFIAISPFLAATSLTGETRIIFTLTRTNFSFCPDGE